MTLEQDELEKLRALNIEPDLINKIRDIDREYELRLANGTRIASVTNASKAIGALLASGRRDNPQSLEIRNNSLKRIRNFEFPSNG